MEWEITSQEFMQNLHSAVVSGKLWLAVGSLKAAQERTMVTFQRGQNAPFCSTATSRLAIGLLTAIRKANRSTLVANRSTLTATETKLQLTINLFCLGTIKLI